MSKAISLFDKWQKLLAIMRDPRVSPSAAMVATVMLDHIDRNTGKIGERRRKKLKLKDISDLLDGRLKRRAVIYAVECLVDTGWLTRTRRRGPPVYDFKFLEEEGQEPTTQKREDEVQEFAPLNGADEVQEFAPQTRDEVQEFAPLKPDEVQDPAPLYPGYKYIPGVEDIPLRSRASENASRQSTKKRAKK